MIFKKMIAFLISKLSTQIINLIKITLDLLFVIFRNEQVKGIMNVYV